MRFDLQCHSTESDGALPPAEVMARAAADGVELVALTDHDTVGGVAAARAAARGLGMRFSPAVELSSVEGPYDDIHILGYELDVEDRGLLDALEAFRRDRVRRTEAIVDRLREFGFALDERPLEARRAQGKPIGRPHIADAVLAHPDNANRLEAEGIRGKNEFFPAYIVPGAKAFVSRSHPTVAEAIELIHSAGGVAVWAHPFWDLDDPDETLATLARFAGFGIDGVEVFYPTHTLEQTHLLHDAATARNMLTTGSTDFHSPADDRFGRFLAFELFGREPNLGPIGGA